MGKVVYAPFKRIPLASAISGSDRIGQVKCDACTQTCAISKPSHVLQDILKANQKRSNIGRPGRCGRSFGEPSTIAGIAVQ